MESNNGSKYFVWDGNQMVEKNNSLLIFEEIQNSVKVSSTKINVINNIKKSYKLNGKGIEISINLDLFNNNFIRLILNSFSNLEVLNSNKVKVVVFDFNVLNIENSILRNYQIILDFEVGGKIQLYQVDYISENIFRSKGLYNANEIIRLILYLVIFILSILVIARFERKDSYHFIIISLLGIIKIILSFVLISEKFGVKINNGSSTIFYTDFINLQIFLSIEILLNFVILTKIIVYLLDNNRFWYFIKHFILNEAIYFFVCFILLILCFALIANKLFGKHNDEYNDYGSSLIYILYGVFGKLKINDITTGSSHVYALFSIVFYFCCMIYSYLISAIIFINYSNHILVNDINDDQSTVKTHVNNENK